MTKVRAMTATEELRKLSKDDKTFMDLVGAVGLTVNSFPAFKAYLAAKAKK